MCGILAVLGCEDTGLAQRARIIELSRRSVAVLCMCCGIVGGLFVSPSLVASSIAQVVVPAQVEAPWTGLVWSVPPW